MRNEFIKNLVSGKISSTEEVFILNSNFQTGFKEGKYVVCTLLANEWSSLDQKYGNEDRTLLQNTIDTILDEITAHNCLHFALNLNHSVLILYMDGFSENSFSSSVYEMLQRFQSTALRYTNISFTAGISCLKENISQISTAYRESIHAAIYRFYIGYRKIFKYGELALKDENPAIKWMNRTTVKRIKDSVERGLIHEIHLILKACLEDINKTYYNVDLVKQFLAEFVLLVRNTLLEYIDNPGEIGLARSEKVYSQFYLCETCSEAENLAFELISEAGEILRKGRAEKNVYPAVCHRLGRDVCRINHGNDSCIHHIPFFPEIYCFRRCCWKCKRIMRYSARKVYMGTPAANIIHR